MAIRPRSSLEIIDRFGPHLSDSTGCAWRRPSRRRNGQDPLLLLRPAVRHPAQGQGQRGHRLRAVGGVSVQPRHALPQGREALPAGLASRPAAARPIGAIPTAPAASGRCRTRRRSRRVAAEIERIQNEYGPDAFAVLSGASLTTEKAYLMGKFARVCLKTPQHRLQRPALHGQRRGRQQEGVRHRSRRQSLDRHPRGRGDLDQRRQRRRVRADHHQLHLAGARERRQASSSSIRASRRIARTCDLFLPDQAGPRRRPVRRRPRT